jgi:nucleoside-diphosphate-sugar epimerase
MKVCVSGASGFLGRYVIAEFQKTNIEVIPVIKTDSKLHNLGKYKNLKITDIYKNNENIFEELGCPDSLIHLAWSGLPNYKSNTHIDKDLPAQFNFLKKLIISGVKNITVAGTCFEYGMINGCLHEQMEVQPSNPYGIAKYKLYQQLNELKKKYNFNLKWCRIFYIYGEGQHENSLWPQLVSHETLGKSFFPMSGGKQIRDFLHVKEVAKYLTTIAMIDIDLGLINICSGKPVSIINLVNYWICKNKWKIKPQLNVYGYPDYEPMEFWGSNSKLKKILLQNDSAIKLN